MRAAATAKDAEDDESEAFSKRLDKWSSYTRGNWRYEDRPRHRDLTISVVSDSDRLSAGLSADMAVLVDAEKSLLAMTMYMTNNGSHGTHTVRPIAVSAEDCMRLKRNTQEKLGRHAQQRVQQEHEREQQAEVLHYVESAAPIVVPTYLGEDTFLTAAPYDEGGGNENEDRINEADGAAEVVDREEPYGGGGVGGGDGGGHSSSMLQIVKRHNSFRLRKQALLQKPSPTPSSSSSIVAPATVDPEPQPVVAPTAATQSLQDSLSELVVSVDRPASAASRATTSSQPKQQQRDDYVAQQPTADQLRYHEQQQRMLLLQHQQQLLQQHQLHQYDYPFDPSDGPQRHHQQQLPSSSSSAVPARYHDVSHAEALLREAENRAAALDGEEDEFIERIRRHERLRHVVEHDLQSYERNVPDVKKTQESWRAAKREHALAAERQAREEAAREAKAEAERAAKAAAQMEALTKFMELKESKAKKARKARRRRSSEDNNSNNDGNQNGSTGGGADDGTTDNSCGTGVTATKGLARSKSAHLASSGGGGPGYRPSWPRDDGRVEYHGAQRERVASAEAAAAKDTAAAAVLQSTALAKPELGNGEKWLKAVLAERKAATAKEAKAKAVAAGATASKVEVPTKKSAAAAPPAMSRRQAVEAAKEKKREEERAWEAARDAKAKGQGQAKGQPKRKKQAASSSSQAGGADPRLEQLLAAAEWGGAEAGLRHDFQSALSLLSPAGAMSAAAPVYHHHQAAVATLTASPGVPGSYAAPHTHWSGMGSIESAGGAAYFPSFQPRATDPGSFASVGSGGHSFAATADLPPATSAPRGAVAEAFPLRPAPIPAPIPAPAATVGATVGATTAPFFDPVSSTADKGRHRVQDPRDFEADSIRCVPDAETRAVTLVTGKRRRRFNPLADLASATSLDPAGGGGSGGGEGTLTEVVAVLFDRHVFATEAEARVWWLTHEARVVAAVHRA